MRQKFCIAVGGGGGYDQDCDHSELEVLDAP